MTTASKRRVEFVAGSAAAGAAVLAVACLAIAPPAAAQPPASTGGFTVTVAVKNVTSDAGSIMGQLCPDAAAFGTPGCVGINASAPAKTGEVQLTFVNVPQGAVALAIFHDENADGQLSFMTEPMAFGNGAKDLPPVFDAASLKVSGDMKTETAMFRMGG